MRRRGVRVFVVIGVIVALSIATLLMNSEDIPVGGARGTGPVGLTLGLDLQGGSHLMYQADLPDEVLIVLEDPVEESDVRAALAELGQPAGSTSMRSFTLVDLSLEQKGVEALRVGLGTLAAIEELTTGDDSVNVRFASTADETDLRALMDSLVDTEFTILAADQNDFTIEGIDLTEAARRTLRTALEARLGPTEVFETTGDAVDVTFRDPLGREDLRGSLDGADFTEANIEVPAQTQYSLAGLSLEETLVDQFRIDLEQELGPFALGGFASTIADPSDDNMRGVETIIRRRVNALGTTEPIIQRFGDDRIVVQLPGVGGTSIDVTFESIPRAVVQIATELQNLGHTGAAIAQAGLETYVIDTEEALPQADKQILQAAAEEIIPRVIVEVDSEDETLIRVIFPTPPGRASVLHVAEGQGLEGASVSERGESRFTIRTDDAITSDEQDALRDILEAELGSIVSYDVSGGIEEAKSLIGGTAQLVFTERSCNVTLAELDLAVNSGLPDPCDPIDQGGGGRLTDQVIGLTGADLARAFPSRDPAGLPELSIWFNSRGTSVFSDFTRRLAGDRLKRLAIILDNEELFAATVQAHITDGRTRITGRFSREQTVTWATQLESGRLPVPLTLIREQSVDALLGADSLRKSLIAGLIGLGLVLLFMLTYYRMAGLVAAVSLLIYAVIVLAIFKLIPVTITLSGIAGLVLSIGMAVDANILIFERMKEEMRTGRSLTSSMEVGFRRAWVAIRDSNVSTIITCAILFMFGSRLGGGTPVVTGFALTLLIGVAVSMFTAIMVSRNLLQIVAITPAGKRLTLFTPESRRQAVGVAGGGR